MVPRACSNHSIGHRATIPGETRLVSSQMIRARQIVRCGKIRLNKPTKIGLLIHRLSSIYDVTA